MNYVNPIEILNLQSLTVSEIDSEKIKKEKKKLFNEIDLSDDECLSYKGISISKSDCEKVIDSIENNTILEYYHSLSLNQELNNFLINGDETIFNSFKQESIYKIPDFLNFLGPFFSPKFDRALLKAFQEKDVSKLKAILRLQTLIDSNSINSAFKSLENEISNRIDYIKILKNKIRDEKSDYSYENIDEIIQVIYDKFPIEPLNSLPIYFQSQINKIGTVINQLQNVIWEIHYKTFVSLKLLEHLLELNIESVDKPIFEKNYLLVKKAHEERQEREKNAPVLEKWAKLLIEIQGKIKQVESKNLSSKIAYEDCINLISISEINSLPSFADEIRTQIGFSLRSLSISCWNVHNDINSALELIDFALKINVLEEARIKLKEDKIELQELKKKYQGVLECFFCEKNSPDDECKLTTTIYKETSRKWFPQRSVQFSYSEIDIPRCSSCKNIHSKGNESYLFIFIGMIFAGIIIGAITPGSHFIIGGIIGTGVGWIIGKVYESNQISESRIKDTTNSTLSDHPLLIERIKNGWTFDKPSA